GEAYFEVMSDKSKPFTVSVNGSSVQVLGTHFNIMAYEDEVLTTTLLEGSVKVKHGKSEQTIVPGQAAKVERGISVHEVNTDNAVAWKNGITVFTNSPIQSIMRQISRWYDLDVEYIGEVPHRLFTGRIPRSAKLSQVLKVLELSDINFKVKDKKIIVTP
ncbi:MAG TPA: FecR domain-containing protein, partial [Sphingobacteriaceae bacterium]